MKRVVGISEIALWTNDKKRALQFYRDLLGLDMISPPALPNVILKAGEGNAGIPRMIVLVPKDVNLDPDIVLLPTCGILPTNRSTIELGAAP